MNLAYLVPFWPYQYTPWLFREVAWMRRQGNHVVVVSLGKPPGPTADLTPYGLTDVPWLPLDRRYPGDRPTARRFLQACLTCPHRAASALPLSQTIRQQGVRHGIHRWTSDRLLFRFLRDHRIEVIEAHWAAEAADLARQVSLNVGVPYAVRLHGGDLYRAPSPNLPGILAQAAAVCPVSHWLLGLMQGQRPIASLPTIPPLDLDMSRVRVCHNSIPSPLIADEPAEQSDDLQRVISIGRLDEEKRHGDLVEACANLASEFPGLRLRLIGGGHLQPKLLEQAKNRGIADRLEITGAVDWDQVMQLRAQGHVYVQASQVEGFCIATLEGISPGVPLICTRTGAYAHFCRPSINGELYDAGDVGALTAHLRGLLLAGGAKRREMGRQTLELIRDAFSFEANTARVQAILQACAQRQPLPP